MSAYLVGKNMAAEKKRKSAMEGGNACSDQLVQVRSQILEADSCVSMFPCCHVPFLFAFRFASSCLFLLQNATKQKNGETTTALRIFSLFSYFTNFHETPQNLRKFIFIIRHHHRKHVLLLNKIICSLPNKQWESSFCELFRVLPPT